MIALRERFSVYALESGRICVAALNSRNLDYVADSIASNVRTSKDGLLTPTRAA
jgi:aromatic-amino-acid transaminase